MSKEIKTPLSVTLHVKGIIGTDGKFYIDAIIGRDRLIEESEILLVDYGYTDDQTEKKIDHSVCTPGYGGKTW